MEIRDTTVTKTMRFRGHATTARDSDQPALMLQHAAAILLINIPLCKRAAVSESQSILIVDIRGACV